VLALITGAFGWIVMKTVDRLGDEARNGGLARTARAGEQVGMTDTVCADSVG
jgi:hypothetical protein